MGGNFSRRLFLSGLVSSLGTPIFAEPLASSLRPVARPPKPLSPSDVANVPSLNKIIGDAALGGRVSFAVADTQTGALLESRSGHWTLPPASVAKALTALYALDTLGADYRFETQLLATGPVENGILNGDLVLSGGGDPLLETNDLATLAAALKATGLREVRGKFLVWGGALAYQNRIDAGQPDHVGYDPAISGLNLNFNRVYFEWKPEGAGFSATLDARSDKYRPDVRTARMKIEDRDFPVYTYRSENGRDHWTVAKGALGNGGGRWLPMRKPDHYVAEILHIFIRSHGIVLPIPEGVSEKPAGRIMTQHQSSKLVDIVRDMLKYSTNITAEVLGMTATKLRGKDASTLRGSANAMSVWVEQKFGVRGIDLIDHSGLGDQSRISATALMTVLVSARQNTALADVMKSVSMRNAQGGPDHEHPIKVKAKTGTLNFVSSLAGYATTDAGKEYAFCIFAADTERRAAIPKQDRERPPGARSWNRRAKRMQQQLIERWGVLYRNT